MTISPEAKELANKLLSDDFVSFSAIKTNTDSSSVMFDMTLKKPLS